MGLGDFDLQVCEEQSECAPLNEAEGLGAQACAIYQCRLDGEPGCEKRPRDLDADGFSPIQCAQALGTEVDCADDPASDSQAAERNPGLTERCDGIDNDCDGRVDETALSVEGPTAVAEVGALPHYLNAEAGAQERVSLVLGATPDAALWPGRGSLQALSYAPLGAEPDGPDNACPVPTGIGRCNFTEAAVARVDDDHLVASINSIGCPDGNLRVGLKTDDDARVQLGSPGLSSSIELGIDTGESACTGQSMGVSGAARPALAAATPGDVALPQGLLTWIADGRQRAPCQPGQPAQVAALGLWLHADEAGWVDASDSGAPRVLGETAGGGAAAMLRFGDQLDSGGYFVGYGNAEGGLSLHFVPFLDDPPADLPLNIASQLELEGEGIDHVALALGATDAAEVGTGLGAAFRMGCGAAAQLGFVAVDFGGSFEGTFEAQEILMLPVRGEVVGGPRVHYVPHGFVTDGGEGEATGGYLVLWIERRGGADQLLLARVQADGSQVVEAEPYQLAEGRTLRFPVLHGARGAPVSYLFVSEESGTKSQLMGGQALCQPPD